ncbi:MAG: neutral/alkaline non-lysosomal ceramidase N-terminal domain-containing protein [Erysipelotrichaceae bacterium]|nr:neutral/alkaline non-lysosomal ceramidase N-terminal domain-containing protein [Erysipelotrichaceae bacterium]
MNVAFKKVEITPYLPVQLSGYGKLQVAYKVHDPLYARAFLFEKDKKEVLWVQLDLAIFDEYLLNLISEKTGVSKENLIVSTTHTHSGPGGTIDTYEGLMVGLDFDLGGYLNPEYCHRIASYLGDAVKEMRQELKPTSLRIIRGKVTGIGTDRHDPSFEADEDALILEFTTQEKKALILRMSCHATVLHEDNLEVSADFPGEIEPHFNDYEMVAFVNGSAGDMSPRFTRRECTFEECKRLGKLAADQVKELLKNEGSIYEDFTMNFKQKVFSVPSKKMKDRMTLEKERKLTKDKIEEAKRLNLSESEMRLHESVLEGISNQLLSYNAFSKITEVAVNVGALELPGLTIVFTPLELFSKLSNPLKKKYSLEFVGYTNGFKCYMPDKRAYELNYYEVFSTPYACGSGELLMEYIEKWLNEEK